MRRPWIKLITAALLLLAQALPVPVLAQGDALAVCGMKCCAAEAMACCCAEPSQAPASPASTPPVAGRELVPAMPWVTVTFFLPPETFTAAAKARFHERRADTQPHVRLPVLFCSLLN